MVKYFKRCLALLLTVSLLAGSFASAKECQAYVRYEYYVILDDTISYALTVQQYEQIQKIWDEGSVEQVLELLRTMFGTEQVPVRAGTVTIRVYTYTQEGTESSGTPDSSKGTVGELPGAASPGDSDFEILSGRLMSYRGNQEIVTIPDTVTSISQGAFYNNNTIRKIIVPASVTAIDSFAFYNCGRLNYIVFAGKCKTVGENMIYRCDKLASVVAPSSSKERQAALKNSIPVFAKDCPAFGQKKLRILQGDTKKLTLYNNLDKIQWKSSRKTVVSVTSAGKIKGLKKGTAKITATVKGKKYPLTVLVEQKSVDKKVQQIIKSTIKKGMNTRQKIKAIHDWLIRNVQYDYDNYIRDSVPAVSHTAKGALLRGVAVCDGYSKAFLKIMKQLGIPCRICVGYSQGGGHAWNQVKVNGKWRYIDVTFDDPIVNGKNTNTIPRYTYFLKTENEMRRDHSW